ncbi:MAG: hypothetical protein P4L36_11760 [Holophaga sp.]|nr:hypothetical protein [Holophaga sp.]
MEPQPVPAARSIHYRRRWFYVLWVALLLLSGGAWILWERPVRMEQASLQLVFRVRNAPPGTSVQVWAGPRSRWEGPGWSGEGLAQAQLQDDGYARLPLLRIQIARRRWVKDYIPRGTWDLLMFKCSAPGAPPRFFALPLSEDIRKGVLRPKWRLTTTINVSWDGLINGGRTPPMP